MKNLIDQQIDRYRITDQLGQGGMAVIYKAYDTRLEREVAIKVIRTKAIPAQQHERLMKRFEREAKAQAQFNHPNIVPVFDYGVHDGMPYLVMEYIPGGTLKERITGPVAWQQVIAWILPIADALAYAHEQGIIHRDVKPSNILLTGDGKPILTDFGIAKVLETTEGTLTGTGMGVGTPEYMAPEQWRGESTEASDQYALGVVLYELLTGRKPFTAETPVAIALKQMRDPLTKPGDLVPGIPEAVEKVVYKALARNPQDRYPDMDSFSQALRSSTSLDGVFPEKALGDQNASQKGHAPNRRRTVPQRKMTWWVIGIVFMTGIILTGLWGFREGWDAVFGNNENGGLAKELGVGSQTTPTSTSTPTMTPTVAPTSTATVTPTITPTPEPYYIFNYVNDNYELMQFNTQLGESTKIMDVVESDTVVVYHKVLLQFSAFWSKDGRYLVYCPKSSMMTNNEYTGKGLYLYDIKTATEIIISDTPAEYFFLGFSPDERNVLFASTINGIPGLFIYNIENEVLKSISYWDGYTWGIRIEWDDDELSFYFMTNQSNRLKKYHTETDVIEDIVMTSTAGAWTISLSPDGDQLFLESSSKFSIINLDSNENIEIDSGISKPHIRFWKWLDNSTIIGSFYRWDTVEEGVFRINADDYEIDYDKDTLLSHPTNMSFFYERSHYVLWGPEFSYDASTTECLIIIDKNTFELINKVCSSIFSNPSRFSYDRDYWLISDHNRIQMMDLDNFEFTIIDINDSILSFSEYRE